MVALDDDEARFIRGLSSTTLSNWNGIAVGRVEATDTLRKLDLA